MATTVRLGAGEVLHLGSEPDEGADHPSHETDVPDSHSASHGPSVAVQPPRRVLHRA